MLIIQIMVMRIGAEENREEVEEEEYERCTTSVHAVAVAPGDKASSPSHRPSVALIMTNGNDGISLPRQTGYVCHSLCLHHLTEKRGCMVASHHFTHQTHTHTHK